MSVSICTRKAWKLGWKNEVEIPYKSLFSSSKNSYITGEKKVQHFHFFVNYLSCFMIKLSQKYAKVFIKLKIIFFAKITKVSNLYISKIY